MLQYDRIILGAGLYGLWSALHCGKRGEKVLVLEYDSAPFMRATYINQARVHMGYHYPRSYSTAVKSAGYFERFCRDYGFCILEDFDQIYATSSRFSWTNAGQFERFCGAAGIRCDRVVPERYFKSGMCDGAFLTREYTYDAQMLKEHLLAEIGGLPDITVRCGARISDIGEDGRDYRIRLSDGTDVSAPFVLNSTYASVNQILTRLGFEPFGIKYELCEIILCEVGESLKHVGLTVMDGPFFSIMPFGKTGLHSLTSVTFTPHVTSCGTLPVFGCQERSGGVCSPRQLGNCSRCAARPESAWDYMSGLAHKYMRDDLGFKYAESLYSMKPVLLSSEVDDSRPTVIRRFSEKPEFVSVLSGKINTVYDLEEILDE